MHDAMPPPAGATRDPVRPLVGATIEAGAEGGILDRGTCPAGTNIEVELDRLKGQLDGSFSAYFSGPHESNKRGGGAMRVERLGGCREFLLLRPVGAETELEQDLVRDLCDSEL